ncbi:MAG: FAD-dependent oxidoreductase [Actinobacteria bacterium]|nr:FAD-dependent oxidoreductase [Actinomycetota bacterium]
MSRTTDVVVLGGGPAGLGAAHQLAGRGVRVTLFEAGGQVGGLAGSTTVGGMSVDFGSHRLHPSIAPEILAVLDGLPGVELQRRQRHGRIRLTDRWVAFPLRVPDVLRHLPPTLAAGMARDALLGPLRRPRRDSFDEVLRAGVGPTLARRFYFPYARKIWGVAPALLSGEQARRRVGANSVVSIARRALEGRRDPPWFWYPRRGFGALAEGLARAARARGADVRVDTPVTGVERTSTGWAVRSGDGTVVYARDVWSTLPVTRLTTMLQPAPLDYVRRDGAALRYRAMLLVYLVLDQPRYTPFDAHYLPEPWTPVTRISEPKNYRDGPDPASTTVLCAELPCAPDDRWWSSSDRELSAVVADTCEQAGLPQPRPRAVTVHRRRYAYPIATADSAARLARIERWVGSLPGVLTLGRQGLFAHDNTHHALAMAWAAAEAFDPVSGLDVPAWTAARAGFRTHVVED